jgi:hypothetical protein
LSCLEPSFFPPAGSCLAQSSAVFRRGSKKAAKYRIGRLLSMDNSGSDDNYLIAKLEAQKVMTTYLIKISVKKQKATRFRW